MKKAGLLILILLTAYIGGIYEDPALMALAVAELLLAVVMWLLAGYMAGRLELQIPAARILAVRGQTFQCRVTVKSRGILPVSRFVVRIGSRYEGGGRREDKKVYGGAMPGESRLWVEERAEPVSLNIQHTAGGIRPLYTPYYSRWDYQRDYQQDGASEQAAARLPGYSFQYYEQQDMDVDWTRQTREMEESAEWFRQIQDIYMEEIQTVYTQVPKEEVRSLAALCREHPASDLADATSVILSVLENSTSYTLTPGSAPVNTDIVEYFLFDSQEGYCVHYASAATLMYRLYGIPARYGAGYAVQPSDFVRQEDGTWVAEVTDESAHAWTEIFLEDYGWTPVEVTPASDGSMLASYPGFDAAAAVLPQVRVDRLSERGRDGEETAEGEPGADENENEDGAGEGLLSGLVSGASERQVWAGCADCGGWSRAGLWSSLPSSWICCISRDTWRGTRGRRRSLAQSWPAR